MQIEEFVKPEQIFREYAYYSSYSASWVSHARKYAYDVIRRFGLNHNSLVVEVASNDGYLLQHFLDLGIPSLGIEPACNVARVACEKGIKTIVDFFGADVAKMLVAEGTSADLVVCNNVLAQVPQINDFVEGIRTILGPKGVVTLEFPSVVQLIKRNQFDTIYHEHFCYFTLTSAARILKSHGLEVFDVENLATHGGSLRVYARHAAKASEVISPSIALALKMENDLGFDESLAYDQFSCAVAKCKHDLLALLVRLKSEGNSIAGYGAPGKGNTLLNYCGVRTDFLDYTVDLNPYKQGKFLPGSRIPVHAPSRIFQTKPDYILILPWNLQDEIIGQLCGVREWGGKFIVPIPCPKIIA